MPINAPTISTSDNADNSGFTVTVVGGDPAATNTVWYNTPYKPTFVAGPSRVGPGLVVVPTLLNDTFLVKVVSVLGPDSATSQVAYAIASGPYPSPHWNGLVSLHKKLTLLDLPEIGNRVLLRELEETAANLKFPCVVVTGESLDLWQTANTCNYQTTFPATVAICQREDPDHNRSLQLWLYWRFRIGEAIMKDRTLGGSVGRLEIQPTPVLMEKMRSYQYVRSYLAVTITAQHARE